jgi:hypothetical protein
MNAAELERYLDAASIAVNLPLRPEDRPGVLNYLALAAGFAQMLDAVPLEPHHENATTFVPVPPQGASE